MTKHYFTVWNPSMSISFSIVELQKIIFADFIAKKYGVRFLPVLNKVDRIVNLDRKNKVLRYLAKRIATALYNRGLCYSFEVRMNPCYRKKQTYFLVIPGLLEFYSLEFVKKYLKLHFKIRFSKKEEISKSINNILSERFPYLIDRLDVESFYESIDQRLLFEIIESNTNLNYEVLYCIKGIFQDFNAFSNAIKGVKVPSRSTTYFSGRGIPRGISISSILAEIYLSFIDKKIIKVNNIIYYYRYVDDILIFRVPPDSNLIQSQIDLENQNYLRRIEAIFYDFKLRLNSTKCCFAIPNSLSRFNYLGYSYCKINKIWKVGLSDSKIDRYRSMIDSAFLDYVKNRSKKKAFPLLLIRIRYLMCFRIHLYCNEKKYSGIPYSNSFLKSNCNDLKILDYYLNNKARQFKLRMVHIQIIRNFRFEDSFRNKTVYLLKSENFYRKVTIIWKGK